ncbi:MAG TPA: S1 RNA-binding domain-containing protein [Microthrixaceae bacterium]|nr:S1 RNA-binding domain-containing protein [Microthrixaceae bacterium]
MSTVPQTPITQSPEAESPETKAPEVPESRETPEVPQGPAAEMAAEAQTSEAPEVPEAPKIGQSAPAGSVVTAPQQAREDPTHAASGGVGVGRIIEVVIASVGTAEVEVRLADGRVGIVDRSEFSGTVASGETVRAALLAREHPKHKVVLSVAWAAKLDAWERIDAAVANSTPVKGTVTRSVKGGFVVDLGVRGFLPSSLVSAEASTGADKLVGTEIEALVTEADRENDRVVLSVRDLERRRRRVKERELLRGLKAGQKVTGTVVNVADYGAVVDLGGVRGLVHRSEITWGRLENVADFVSVGDSVEVLILDLNKSKRKVSLSIRQVEPDPMDAVSVGEVASSTVVRVVEYGAFVRLDDNGVEGLVHISELSDVPVRRPDEFISPGEQLTVKVLKKDMDRRRLALTARRFIIDG